MDAEEILEQAHFPRLCLTGGEPLLQLEGVAELLEAAERRLLRVHLETNGTIDPRRPCPADAGFDWVTVSPKPPDYVIAAGLGGPRRRAEAGGRRRLDAATAERLAAAHPEAIVSIQPEWGGGAAPADGDRRPRQLVARRGRKRFERAVALVMAHPDWRLSLQTHKYLGIR